MRARLVLFVVLFSFLSSSISTAEEAQNKKVRKAGYQERESMGRSLAGGDKNGNPIVQEANGTSPKEPPQPPSAPKGLRIQTKSK
jgi:hypothetical protein